MYSSNRSLNVLKFDALDNNQEGNFQSRYKHRNSTFHQRVSKLFINLKSLVYFFTDNKKVFLVFTLFMVQVIVKS